MIRRGFWLVTGAALGVTGYRKATRLARTVTGQHAVGQLNRGASRSPWPGRLVAGAGSAAGFLRDVRAGMADYRALRAGPNRGPQAERNDALQDEEIGRSLQSQRDRTLPDPGQRGQREP